MDYWSAFDSKLQQTNTISPLIDQVSRFYSTNKLYHITCHPTILDFGTFINDGKIILLSLRDRDNKWPEFQREVLGGILVAQVQMAAMSRKYHAKPFYLYIDEAELFVSAPIAKILSEAGKYGLSLTLANQHLAQLKGDTLKGVMGNIGAMVAFRIGHDDARELHSYLPKFEIVDLVNMDKANAAVNMQYCDQTYTFSLTTH